AVSRALDRLLSARPRPTGIISTCPEHCVTVLCHLLNAGLRVPDDVSIVSGSDDEFLEFALPRLARYRFDGMKIGRKAGTILLDLIQHGPGKLSTASVLPRFVPGETLGPAPG